MVRELFDKLATLAKLCKIEQSLDNMHQNAIALEQEKKQEYQARYDKDMQKIRGIRKWALPLAFYSAVFSIVWVVLAIIGNPQINIFRLVFAALRNPFTLVALIGMVFLCSIKSRKQKHEEKYKQIWNDEYQSQVEDLHAIMERTKSRICELREQNEGVFAFLPGKYRNLQAVSFMLIAVRDGRAETDRKSVV